MTGARLRSRLPFLALVATERVGNERGVLPRRTRSLAKRLLLISLAAALPALFALLVNELDLRAGRDREVRDLAYRQAIQARSELERVFEGVENLLRAVGEVPAVRDFQTEGCAPYLRALLGRMPYLRSLSVLDITGRVQCQDWTPRDEQRYHTLPYFRDVLATKRFVTGSFTRAALSGRGVLPLAAPLLQPSGTFNGVIVAALDLEWLRNRLGERGLADNVSIIVTDRTGVVLVGAGEGASSPGDALPEILERILRSSEAGAVTFEQEPEGRRVIGLVPADTAAGVHVLADMPYDAAFANLDRNAHRSVAMVLAGLLLTLVVIWLAGQIFIERPIQRILDAVASWRLGERSARTGMRPDHGEIEAVGAALDELLDGVASRQEALEREAAARAESERRYRGLIELSPDAEFVDIDSRIVYANAAMFRLLGAADAASIIGRSSYEFIAPEFHDLVRERIASLKRTSQPNPPVEQRWIRLDGRPIDVEVTSAAVPWDGHQGNQVILRDISARKQAEERQDILMHELNHRVKNTLATVQSLALQTLRTAPSLAAFKQAFMARLLALSATQTLLTQRAWEHAPLHELLDAELRAYGEERYLLQGQDVLLPPQMAMPLGMVLHELATNAAKYGALASPRGRVHVGWSVAAGGRLHLEWREEGGPAVEPPTGQGFGSTLIERTIVGELDGSYRREFDPNGLICVIDVPIGTSRSGAANQRICHGDARKTAAN